MPMMHLRKVERIQINSAQVGLSIQWGFLHILLCFGSRRFISSKRSSVPPGNKESCAFARLISQIPKICVLVSVMCQQ